MALLKLLSALLLGTCLLQTVAAQGRDYNDITDGVNYFLEGKLSNISDNYTLSINVPVTIDLTGYVVIDAQLDKPTLSGYTSMVARDCAYDINAKLLNMTLVLPVLGITTDHYTIDGNVLNTIDLWGQGKARFTLENFEMTIHATMEDLIYDGDVLVCAQFEAVTLELVLERWTIYMENLMEGTDFGTMMTEFLMMMGPDIFYVLGDNLTDGTALVKILNILFDKCPGGQ